MELVGIGLATSPDMAVFRGFVKLDKRLKCAQMPVSLYGYCTVEFANPQLFVA